MASGRLIVGIDLGTTHTVVAWADPEDLRAEPQIFPIPQLVAAGEIAARPLFPSYLYAPTEGETAQDPWGDAPWVTGQHARVRGGEVAGRLVSSAKSWLCHPGVDREAAILPWGGSEEDDETPRISPVDASATLLRHVRAAWDDAHPGQPLAEQEVVLTVPASFDEVARELSVEAAKRAGLTVRLLEEPQAAFYDFLQQAGEARLQPLLPEGEDSALVLVCDVGGGTTDLSLLRVERAETAGVTITRVAVGNHLLLGGDNMDLALAHLAEPRLVEPSDDERPRLDPRRFGQLVIACRAAKEKLLGDDPPDEASVTVLASGSRLFGGSKSTKIAREDAARIVLDGFFPIVLPGEKPARGRGALVAFGLPFERDVAITRHVGSFFARHAPGEKGPRALLLNGGVFRAAAVVERLTKAIEAWGGPPLDVLPHEDPDVAVARGAVAFGLSLRGRGKTIEGGAARGYYVGIGSDQGEKKAICVVPRGSKEGQRHLIDERPLALLVGRPVRFDLFASDDDAVHAPGEVVTIDDERFQMLPPLATTIASKEGREVRVALVGELTAVGTLDLACVETEVSPPESARRFRLAFQLREGAPAPLEAKTQPKIAASRISEAVAALDHVFGRSKTPAEPREVKGIVRELERILGERPTWTSEVARGLFDALSPNQKSRRRSVDHERMFWSLSGYCLRPGYGHPEDPSRIATLAPLFAERLTFSQEARGWQQFWIAWRRIAGGLSEATQSEMRQLADPFLAPSEKRLKKPKGVKPEALDLLLELASSLERVPPLRRSELGHWLLERTWTDRDPRLWAAIGRLGARVPTYASVHHVIAPNTVERWLDHLLREKWESHEALPKAAVQLARMTGDRARDVSDRVRNEVKKKLIACEAKPEWMRAVEEHVAASEAEQVEFFGESLPLGLRLA